MKIGWCFSMLLMLVSSVPAGANGDQLQIAGMESGESVVVMWIGRTSAGCMEEHQILNSTGDVQLPNLLPEPENLSPEEKCVSEIAVFSRKHAMVHESVDTWTDSPGDVRIVQLKPLITVPISVWTTGNADEQRARRDMETAGRLFTTNRVGIKLDPRYRRMSVDMANRIEAEKCRIAEALKASPFYTANTLNVYYLGDPGLSSRNCAIVETPPDCENANLIPVADGNITYITGRSTVTTLAHELGHAFGLRPSKCGGHTNPEETPQLSGLFGPDNIMWAAGDSKRQNFTPGQVFRMNVQKDQWGGTMLIKNEMRPGPGRECPSVLASRSCPALHMPWPQ
jgi:hypothetical protein